MSQGSLSTDFWKISKGKTKYTIRFTANTGDFVDKPVYYINGKAVSKSAYQKKLKKAKKGYKFRWAGTSRGVKASENNISKIITNPKSVTK